MLMTGAQVTDIKSISAAKPKREGGHSRQLNKTRRGSANVLWKRVTASYDEEVRKFAANPALVSPITRWVLFQHLTPTQGMAGRRYADIVRKYHSFTVVPQSATPRSANLEPSRGGEDQTIVRHQFNGTLAEYEDQARYAKRSYKRLMKVLDRFKDPITGRNLAKDALDELCIADREPAAQLRQNIGAVLSAVAKEFGIGERKRNIT
jgi:hypothetical protein